jgi:hypothetical protein
MTCLEDKMNKDVGTSKRENSDRLIFLKLHNACVKRQHPQVALGVNALLNCIITPPPRAGFLTDYVI